MTPGFPCLPARLLPFGAALAAFSLLVPPAVSAQDLGEELDAIADTTAAGADTLGAGPPGAGGFPGPGAAPSSQQNAAPNYNTTYNVDRTTTAWLQNLKFGSRVGFLQFTNETNFGITDDNGYNQIGRRGENRLNINWLMLRRLPINTDFDVRRETLTRPGEERQTNVANLNASAVFNPTVGALRNTFTVGGGYNRTGIVSVYTEDSAKSTDSGLQGNMAWRGNWRVSRKLNMSSNLRQQLSNKTSKLQNRDGSGVSTPTKNVQRTFSLNANYDPLPWASGSLTVTDNQGEDQSYLAQAGQGFLEKRKSHQRSLGGRVSLEPRAGTDVTANFNVYNNSLDLSHQRDNASDSDGLRWDVTLNTQFLRTDIEATLSGSTDNLQPATSATTKNVTSNFDGKAVRVVNPKVTLQFNWLLRANQLFFSNLNPKGDLTPEQEEQRRLDRDELRTKLQPTLIYRPGRKWQVTASLIRSTIEQVQLNPTRASQTRSDEDYNADFAISFLLSDRTTITQNYSIKALYTTYRYNPKSDRLLRTERITTLLESSITQRVFLGLEHRYTRQDSGPFERGPGGRVFARNLRSYTQELTATLNYDIFPWLAFNFSSRLLRDDDIQEATQIQSTYRNLEVIEGVNLNRNMGLGMSFQAKAFHTRSNQRPSYWTLASSLTKQF